MRHVDFAPLYRSTVGFDRLVSMLDGLSQPDSGQTYPPYNIERTGENAYRITMAVAGFDETELSIESRENVLTVKGEKAEKEDAPAEVLYRGIAGRVFERRFQLIPEAMKPRTIAINTVPGNANGKQIEAAAA